MNLTIHMQFPDSTGNKLGVLRAEVQNEHLLAMRINQSYGRLCLIFVPVHPAGQHGKKINRYGSKNPDKSIIYFNANPLAKRKISLETERADKFFLQN